MKTTIVLILTFFATSLFAQDSLTSLKPTAGDRVLTIGIINNSGFWAAKKYRSDQKACRLSINGTFNIKPKESYSVTNTNGTVNNYATTSTAFTIGIFAGMQKSFGSLKRVEPYIGADLGLSYSYFSDLNKSSGNDPLNNNYNETKRTRPFSLSLAFLPLVGFNYYIAPRFALGAEYRLSIASINYAGENKVITTSDPSTSYPSSTIKNDAFFSFSSNFTGTAYITATLFFK